MKASSSESPDARQDRVFVGWISSGTVESRWTWSLVELLLHDARTHQYVTRDGGVMEGRTSRIASGRNHVVAGFLATPGEPEWLWMVDTDMVFPVDTLDRLMEVAEPTTRPVVGALCFAQGDVALYPTIYRLVERDGGIQTKVVLDYPRDELMRCDAMGAACLLMHRDALMAVGAKWAHTHAPWFLESGVGTREYGEDVMFGVRLAELGVPVHVDTRIKVGHVKEWVIDEIDYEEERAQQAALGDEEFVRRRRAPQRRGPSA